ncbi:MAG: WYL domain-containing protein, partial [Deltaproteobacteria bacterium]|nr:WYL domain-containing protein [Deltaproteobacteria bacterium]
ARDEDNNEYWFIEKRDKRSTLDEIIPDNDGIYGDNRRAIDNIENILRLYFYKRFFENFRIKSIRTDVDREYENFINSLKYKKEVESFIRNIDKIFYFFWYAPKTERYNENILQNIVKGILFKKILSIKYCGLGYNKSYETMVKPLSIIYYGGLLYLLGLGATRRHRGIRTFAIDRIENVSTTGKNFGFNYDRYDPEKHINKYIGIMTSKNKSRFEIIFSNDPVLKKLIMERKWFENQKFTELSDGRLSMRFTAYPTIEVKRWILSYGKDAEVVKPKGFLESDSFLE